MDLRIRAKIFSLEGVWIMELVGYIAPDGDKIKMLAHCTYGSGSLGVGEIIKLTIEGRHQIAASVLGDFWDVKEPNCLYWQHFVQL